jgi:hypothetical protein
VRKAVKVGKMRKVGSWRREEAGAGQKGKEGEGAGEAGEGLKVEKGGGGGREKGGDHTFT